MLASCNGLNEPLPKIFNPDDNTAEAKPCFVLFCFKDEWVCSLLDIFRAHLFTLCFLKWLNQIHGWLSYLQKGAPCLPSLYFPSHYHLYPSGACLVWGLTHLAVRTERKMMLAFTLSQELGFYFRHRSAVTESGIVGNSAAGNIPAEFRMITKCQRIAF